MRLRRKILFLPNRLRRGQHRAQAAAFLICSLWGFILGHLQVSANEAPGSELSPVPSVLTHSLPEKTPASCSVPSSRQWMLFVRVRVQPAGSTTEAGAGVHPKGGGVHTEGGRVGTW